MRWGNALHDPGAEKSADHEAEDVKLQVIRCLLGGDPLLHVLGEANDKAGHAYLSSDVEKLGEHPAEEMAMRKNFAPPDRAAASLVGVRLFAHLGQIGEIDDDR